LACFCRPAPDGPASLGHMMSDAAAVYD